MSASIDIQYNNKAQSVNTVITDIGIHLVEILFLNWLPIMQIKMSCVVLKNVVRIKIKTYGTNLILYTDWLLSK